MLDADIFLDDDDDDEVAKPVVRSECPGYHGNLDENIEDDDEKPIVVVVAKQKKKTARSSKFIPDLDW